MYNHIDKCTGKAKPMINDETYKIVMKYADVNFFLIK